MASIILVGSTPQKKGTPSFRNPRPPAQLKVPHLVEFRSSCVGVFLDCFSTECITSPEKKNSRATENVEHLSKNGSGIFIARMCFLEGGTLVGETLNPKP